MTTITEYMGIEDGPAPVVLDVLTQCHDGLLTVEECDARLDTHRVRGGWSAGSYTGFDYRNQRWIGFAHGRLDVAS